MIVGLSLQAAQPTENVDSRRLDPVVARERIAAQNGDVLAKCRANDRCLYLDLPKPYPAEDLILDLEKLAEEGRPDAIYRLGVLKIASESTREQGRVQIQQATEKGSPYAQNHWAYICLKEKNDAEAAAEWWRKARENFAALASTGDLDAMYILGAAAPPAEIKDSTDFPPLPKDQSLKWLQRAANGGHLGSIMRLAKSLGEDGASKADQEASWKWYSQAAESGYWRALVDVGVLFEFGFSKYKPSFLGKNHAKAWDAWDRAILIAGDSDFYAALPLSKEELPPHPKK